MKVTLPADKCAEIVQLCIKLKRKLRPSIHQVASVTGKLVATFPAVQFGPLHYRELEKDKTAALSQARGDYKALMTLSSGAVADLDWWIKNLKCAYADIIRPKSSLTLETDASGRGWGATDGQNNIGGQWNDIEAVKAESNEINHLELWAAFLALRAFVPDKRDIHVLIRMDNTTAVAYVNHMGGTKSHNCNEVAKEIWEWCQARHIWITAAHLPGVLNIVADHLSRNFNDQTEWQLNKQIFQRLCSRFGNPDIDLFASRLNCQLNKFIAWHPDPDAIAVDAFTVDWSTSYFYAFPPFCLLPRVLQKITFDQATGLVIVPCWPTQAWFPRLVQLLAELPVMLPKFASLVTHPVSREPHPLSAKMYLMCCRLSGRPSEVATFQARQQTSSCNPGGHPAINSTGAPLPSGGYFARNGKRILCEQLYL
jgi:hypothetical protein